MVCSSVSRFRAFRPFGGAMVAWTFRAVGARTRRGVRAVAAACRGSWLGAAAFRAQEEKVEQDCDVGAALVSNDQSSFLV